MLLLQLNTIPFYKVSTGVQSHQSPRKVTSFTEGSLKSPNSQRLNFVKVPEFSSGRKIQCPEVDIKSIIMFRVAIKIVISHKILEQSNKVRIGFEKKFIMGKVTYAKNRDSQNKRVK